MAKRSPSLGKSGHAEESLPPSSSSNTDEPCGLYLNFLLGVFSSAARCRHKHGRLYQLLDHIRKQSLEVKHQHRGWGFSWTTQAERDVEAPCLDRVGDEPAFSPLGDKAKLLRAKYLQELSAVLAGWGCSAGKGFGDGWTKHAESEFPKKEQSKEWEN